MSRLSRLAVGAVLAVGVALAGCTDDASDTPDNTRVSAELLDQVGVAVAALTADGFSADDLAVILAESVMWKDGALGCPEPGQVYTQALVAGYRIVIATPEGDIAFHGEDGADPRRCDNPQAPAA